MYYLLTFLSFWMTIKIGQTQDCLGNPPSQCLDCSYDSYKPTIGIDSTTYISTTICQKKDPAFLSKTIFITNKKCVVGSPCNGTVDYPYDNIITAFINEGNVANKKAYSNLTFKILGSPHFIIRKHLPKGREQIFRRLNATISIRPHYCDESLMTGCFSFSNKPTIFIKVDIFYFYISYSVKIHNITFDGTDFHLFTSATANSATANYNLESTVCNYSAINVTYTAIPAKPCALGSRTLRLGEPKDFTRFVGLFTLEGILDNPSSKVPDLLIENCEFLMFYATKSLDGWLAFLVANNKFPSSIKVLNCSFRSFRFAMGFVYVHDREDINKNSTFKYSGLFSNSPRLLEFSNIVIEAYNEFNIFGNMFTYLNRYEYELYCIFNILKFDGEINIIQSVFQNIFQKAKKHSFFNIRNILQLQMKNVIFRNLTYLFSIVAGEALNLSFEGVMFQKINLYYNFLKIYSSNFILRNSQFIDFQATAQSDFFFELMALYNGSFLFEKNIFINTSNMTFYLENLIKIEIQNSSFENFLAFMYQPLFTVTDSSITLRNITLSGILGVFSYLVQLNRNDDNPINVTLFDVHIFNVLKLNLTINIYYIASEDCIYDTVTSTQICTQILQLIRTIYPLEAVFFFKNSRSEDILLIENLFINNLESDTLISFGKAKLINMTSINWDNSNLSNHKIKLVEASFYKNFYCFSLNITNALLTQGFINLISNDSYASIVDVKLAGISIFENSEIIFCKGGRIIGSNILVSNITQKNASLKPTSLISVQECQEIELHKIRIFLKSKLKLISIIFIYYSEILSINDITIIFEYIPGNNIDFAHTAGIIGFYVRNVVIDTFIVSNLKEFVNDSMITQNGFINFLGSSQNIIIYEENDFSINILNTFLINCSYYINGVVSIINYKFAYLENIQIFNSSSYYGGGFFMKYVTNLKFFRIYLETLRSNKGGALYITDVNSITLDNFFILNCSSELEAGLAFLSFIDDFRFQNSSIFQIYTLNKGALCLQDINKTNIKEIYASEIYISSDGGFLYLAKGSLELAQIRVFNIHATNGGLVFLKEGNTISFYNISCEEISITSKGALLFISRAENISLLNITLNKIEGNQAQGNIYIENQLSSNIVVENYKVTDSKLYDGNLLFFYSKSNFTFKNVYISNCSGNLLQLRSFSHSLIKFENSRFENNEAKNGYLIITNNVSLVFFGEKNLFINNTAKVSVFYIEESNITMKNSYFSKTSPNMAKVFYLFRANCIFNNVEQNTSTGGFIYHEEGESFLSVLNSSGCADNSSSCFTFSKMNNITIEKSKFKSLSSGLSKGMMLITYSSCYLLRSNFSGGGFNKAISEEIIADFSFLESFGIFKISFCHFSNYGQMLSLIIAFTPCIEINSVIFEFISTKAIANGFSRGLEIRDNSGSLVLNSNVSIISSTFRNFYGTINVGSSLSLISKKSECFIHVFIADSAFENNQAGYGGAIFLKGYLNCTLNKNIFKMNRAYKDVLMNEEKGGIGGAIYFASRVNANLFFRLLNNTFRNNEAEHFAPTVWSFIKILLDDYLPNTFENNIDILGFSSELAGLPLKIVNSKFFINTHPLNLFETKDLNTSYFIIPGISFAFSGEIKDSFNQSLIFSYSSSVKLNASSSSENPNITSPLMQGGNNFTFQGEFEFQNILVNYRPDQYFNLEIIFSYETEKLMPEKDEFCLEESVAETLYIFSRPCLKGELYNSDEKTCKLCPQGTYSLINPMPFANNEIKCQACPDNAFCFGSFITPKPGFWRASNESSLIIECFNKDACLGYQENLTPDERVHGKCAIHHSGPLCYICEKDFARSSSKGFCQACKDNPMVYIRFIFGVLGIFLYIFLQVHYTFKSRVSSYSGIFIKLLVNHFQQISLISLMDLDWTPDIKIYFSLQEYVSFLTDDLISVDCLLQNYDFNILAQKVIVSIVMPVILSFAVLLIWFISFLVHSSLVSKLPFDYFLDRLRVSSLVIVYILHPEILRKCFSMFNCMNIENVYYNKVLTLSPDIECLGSDHLSYIYKSALPGMLLWGLLAPLFIGYLFKAYKKPIVIKIKLSKNPGSAREEQTQRDSLNTDNIASLGLKFHPVRVYPEGKPQSREKKVKDIKKKYSPKEKIEASPVTIELSVFKRRENVMDTEKLERDLLERGKLNADDEEVKVRRISEKLQRESLKLDMENMKKLSPKEEHMTSNLKFLYKGYSHKYYYWELVLFLKKISLISIGSLTQLFPGSTKPTILLIVISIFLFLQTEYKPFEIDSLNRIELLSLMVTFLTSNIGILLLTKEMKSLSNLFMVVIIIINIFYLLVWFWYYSKEILHKSAFLLNLRRVIMNILRK